MKFELHNPEQITQHIKQVLTGLSDNQKAVVFIPGGSFIKIFDKLIIEVLTDPTISTANLEFALTDERVGSDSLTNNYISYQGLVSHKLLSEQGVKFHSIYNSGDDWITTTQQFNSLYEKFVSENYYKIGFLGMGKDYHMAGILPHSLDDANIFYHDWAVGYEMTDGVNEYNHRITLNFLAIANLDFVALCANVDDPVWELQKGKSRADGMAIADKPALFLKNLNKVSIYQEGYIPKS